MKNALVYPLFFLIGFCSLAQNYSWEGASFGDGNGQSSVVYRMDISNTDEKVVVGKFSGSMHIGNHSIYSNKPVGLFLAKYAANDSLLWLKTIAEAEEISDVTFTPIIGSIPNIKFDSFGAIYIGVLYIDSMLIDGLNYYANDSIPSYYTANVLKYTSDGTFVNNIRVRGSCYNSMGYDNLSVDALGNIYSIVNFGNDVWGTTISCNCIVNSDTLTSNNMNYFLAKFNHLGETLWLENLSIRSAKNLAYIERALYVSGISPNATDLNFGVYTLDFPSNYEYAAYVAKYDTTGNFQWAKYFGVPNWGSNVQVRDIHAASNNAIIVSGKTVSQTLPNQLYFENAATLLGNSFGSTDAFVVCYDSLGNVKWHEMTNSSGAEWYSKASSDSLGNVFLAGTFSGEVIFGTDTLQSSGGYDVFIRALSPEGAHLWAKKIVGSGGEFLYDMHIDSKEDLYLVGESFSSQLEFGEHSYSLNSTSAQLFIAKLSAHNVDLEDVQQLETLVYPNPNQGAFSLQAKQSIQQLDIYTVLGALVYSQSYTGKNKEIQVRRQLAPGSYFIVLGLEDGAKSLQKVIVN